MRMSDSYIESLQAHVDEGGKLTHQNAVELLEHVRIVRAELGRVFRMWADEADKGAPRTRAPADAHKAC